jgi:hypothetical protein
LKSKILKCLKNNFKSLFCPYGLVQSRRKAMSARSPEEILKGMLDMINRRANIDIGPTSILRATLEPIAYEFAELECRLEHHVPGFLAGPPEYPRPMEKTTPTTYTLRKSTAPWKVTK